LNNGRLRACRDWFENQGIDLEIKAVEGLNIDDENFNIRNQFNCEGSGNAANVLCRWVDQRGSSMEILQMVLSTVDLA
jgi:hypothetical protein